MRLYLGPTHRGQTLVELALVLPLFLMVLVGIIGLGIGVFYQQQISNAAREAARYASIHSASSLLPTAGTYDPATTLDTYPVPGGADRKVDGWPYMTAHARDAVFGLRRADVKISACWSGYQSATGERDAPPPGTYDVIGTITSSFVQCSIDGVDPTVDLRSVGCRNGMPTTDQASSQSESSAIIVANTVTAYACYVWSPPMAGFLLIPSQVTLRAVATEPIERQQ
jgi:TadE-like protein